MFVMVKEEGKINPIEVPRAVELRTRDDTEDALFAGKTEAGKKKIINWASSVAGDNLDTLAEALISDQANFLAKQVNSLEEMWMARGAINGILLVQQEINRIAQIIVTK